MYGNRAATVRSGVAEPDVFEAVGGDHHLLHLPVPGPSSHGEISSRTPSPYVVGLGKTQTAFSSRGKLNLSLPADYFVFGKRKGAPYEGLLLCLNPWSYFVQMRRVRKRDSQASKFGDGCRRALPTLPSSRRRSPGRSPT